MVAELLVREKYQECAVIQICAIPAMGHTFLLAVVHDLVIQTL